jgi:hypothetical protein
MNKLTFVLLPGGHFVSFIGATYFCGFYRGENTPDRPIEVALPFPFDYLFVSFRDDVLQVNHTCYPYRHITLATTPPMPLVGCQTSSDLGWFITLERLQVVRGTLIANGLEKGLRDFPIALFELESLDIARANRFISWGFNRLGLVYSWYRPIVFISFEKASWMTYYLRLRFDSERGIER